VDLQTFIFIGRSGCGKGTQATLLKDRIHNHDLEKRQILYIETGDKFREFIRGRGFSALLSKEIYDRDDRQPDFLACFMWSNMLLEELEDNMHLVFDGAPRSLSEARLLTTALAFYKRKNTVVIHLNVSRKWSEERLLSRGRSDDASLSKINKRLDWFDKDVVPALDFFKNTPGFKFIEVNGEQSIENVHREIVSKYDNDKA